MQRITLARTGNRPVTFDGEKIAESSSRYVTGREANRWHDLAMYLTTNGNFVLSVQYGTQWQGELDHADAVIVDSAEAVADYMRSLDPNEHATGMPIYNEAMRTKEDRRRADLKNRYDAAVSELLAVLPEELA